MGRLRVWTLTLTVAVLSGGLFTADDEKNQDPPQRGQRGQRAQPGQRGQRGNQDRPATLTRVSGGPLLTKEAMDKLNLSDEQKKKVEKLVKEFGDKQEAM